MNFLKRKLPLVIVFFTGMIMMIAYYVPHPPFADMWKGASSWYMVIAGFTLVLGVVSLIRNHYRKIRLGKQGFGYSIVMFIALVITAVFGVLPPEDVYLLRPKDIENEDWTVFCSNLVNQGAEETPSSYRRLWNLLPDDARSAAREIADTGQVTEKDKELVITGLNSVLANAKLYQQGAFPDIYLSSRVKELLKKDPDTLIRREIHEMNRNIFMGAFPDQIPEIRKPMRGNKAGSVFMWVFDFINSAAASTVFSLLAFYIASAAYRAFRVRTLDATVMLITALIVMIGRVPYGEMFSNFITESISPHLVFLRLDKLTTFFLNYPTVAAKRAIILGMGLAMVSTSMRVILGIERTYMGSDE